MKKYSLASVSILLLNEFYNKNLIISILLLPFCIKKESLVD